MDADTFLVLCNKAIENKVGSEFVVAILRKIKRQYTLDKEYQKSLDILTKLVQRGEGIDLALDEVKDVLDRSNVNESTVNAAVTLLAALLDHNKGKDLALTAISRCSQKQNTPFETLLTSMIRNGVQLNAFLKNYVEQHPTIQFASAFASRGQSIKWVIEVAENNLHKLESSSAQSDCDSDVGSLVLILVKMKHAYDTGRVLAKNFSNHFSGNCRALAIDIYHALATNRHFLDEAKTAAQNGLFDCSQEVREKSFQLLKSYQ